MIGWAVEFELRARIGHLDAIVAYLDIGLGEIRDVNNQCERMMKIKRPAQGRRRVRVLPYSEL